MVAATCSSTSAPAPCSSVAAREAAPPCATTALRIEPSSSFSGSVSTRTAPAAVAATSPSPSRDKCSRNGSPPRAPLAAMSLRHSGFSASTSRQAMAGLRMAGSSCSGECEVQGHFRAQVGLGRTLNRIAIACSVAAAPSPARSARASSKHARLLSAPSAFSRNLPRPGAASGEGGARALRAATHGGGSSHAWYPSSCCRSSAGAPSSDSSAAGGACSVSIHSASAVCGVALDRTTRARGAEAAEAAEARACARTVVLGDLRSHSRSVSTSSGVEASANCSSPGGPCSKRALGQLRSALFAFVGRSSPATDGRI